MIYLDNAATTKPSSSAMEKASVYVTEEYFNPSGKYRQAVKLTADLAETRKTLLSLVGKRNGEVIFTSCGTESDNTAVFCHVGKGKCVTTEGEHSAIDAAFEELSRRGTVTEKAKLHADGSVDVEDLLSKIDERTAFVSVIHVNNETGAINDINSIAKKVKAIAPRCIFHSDGVQAFGKIPVSLSADVDLYSISAHKIGGLKGVGALIAKPQAIHPFVFGGGQESGLRSGTENVFGIKVLEYAAKEKCEKLSENFEKVSAFHQKMRTELAENGFQIISGNNVSPYVLSVSAGAVRGEVLLHMLENYGVLVGTGSACSSKNRFSRIIRACGYGEDVLDGVVRISFSAETTEEEVAFATEKMIECANKLKKVMGVSSWKK